MIQTNVLENVIDMIISTGAVPGIAQLYFTREEVMDIEKKAYSSNDEKLEKYIRTLLKKRIKKKKTSSL